MNTGWLDDHANPLNSMRNTPQNVSYVKIIIEKYVEIMRIFNGQNGPNVLLYTL